MCTSSSSLSPPNASSGYAIAKNPNRSRAPQKRPRVEKMKPPWPLCRCAASHIYPLRDDQRAPSSLVDFQETDGGSNRVHTL